MRGVFLKILKIMFFVVIVEGMHAQEIRTLADCLEKAYQYDIRLKISRQQKEFQLLEWEKSKNQRLPEIRATGLYNRIGKVTSFTMPAGPGGELRKFEFGTHNRMSLDVKLSVPIFTAGRLSSGISINEKILNLSDIQTQRIKNQITEQVIRLYLSIALNQSVLKIREEDWQRSLENLKTAKIRYKEGNVSELHVIRAQAEIEKVKNSMEEVQTNLRNSLLALSSLTGVDTAHIYIHPELKMVDFDSRQKSLEKKIFTNNSRFREIDIQLTSMNDRMKIARASRMPMLLAIAGYNVVNGFDPVNPEKFVDNWNAGVQLSIPLFDGWQSKLNEQQIKIQQKQISLQREALLREYRLKYGQKVQMIHQAQKSVLHMEKIIQSNKRAYEVARDQYKQGFLSQLDLINARFQYTMSELLKQQALFTYLMNVLDICSLAEDYSIFSTYFE